MNQIKRILKIVIGTILLLFYSIVIYIFIMDKITNSDYIKIFNYTYFIIVSGSMENEIKVNDLVLVKLTDKVKEKDIITYKKENGKVITHRVIKIDKDQLITKGDANLKEDNPINRNQIIGKVIFHINPSIIFYSISILLFIYILLIVTDLKKSLKKKE